MNIRAKISECIATQDTAALELLLSSLTPDELNTEINNHAPYDTPLQEAIRLHARADINLDFIKTLLKFGADPIVSTKSRARNRSAIDMLFSFQYGWYTLTGEQTSLAQIQAGQRSYFEVRSVEDIKKIIARITSVIEVAILLIQATATISTSAVEDFITKKDCSLLHYMPRIVKDNIFGEEQLTRIFTAATIHHIDFNTVYKVDEIDMGTDKIGKYGLACMCDYLVKNTYFKALSILLASAINSGMYIDARSLEIAESYRHEFQNINLALNTRENANIVLSLQSDQTSRFATIPKDVLGMVLDATSPGFFARKLDSDRKSRLAVVSDIESSEPNLSHQP